MCRTLPWEPGLGVWREPPVCIRGAATQVGGDSGRSPGRAVRPLPASSLSLVATLDLPTIPSSHLSSLLPPPPSILEVCLPRLSSGALGPAGDSRPRECCPPPACLLAWQLPRARPGVPGGLAPQRWAAPNEPRGPSPGRPLLPGRASWPKPPSSPTLAASGLAQTPFVNVLASTWRPETKAGGLAGTTPARRSAGRPRLA